MNEMIRSDNEFMLNFSVICLLRDLSHNSDDMVRTSLDYCIVLLYYYYNINKL